MYTDLAECELREYHGSVNEPVDFDEFWDTTLPKPGNLTSE